MYLILNNLQSPLHHSLNPDHPKPYITTCINSTATSCTLKYVVHLRVDFNSDYRFLRHVFHITPAIGSLSRITRRQRSDRTDCQHGVVYCGLCGRAAARDKPWTDYRTDLGDCRSYTGYEQYYSGDFVLTFVKKVTFVGDLYESLFGVFNERTN